MNSADLNIIEARLKLPRFFSELFRFRWGSNGTSIHNDPDNIMACIFIISGRGDFSTYSKYSGTNPRQFDSSPGSAIFLRGNGFRNLGAAHHSFRNIKAGGYVLAIRGVID